MTRDQINRTGDPGASEFAGDPDDVRVGIVPDFNGAAPVRELLAAYWTNPDNPGSSAITEDIGDTDKRNTVSSEITRQNQFRLSGPTYGRDIEP